jgi:rRNA maturation RNase YbeY
MVPVDTKNLTRRPTPRFAYTEVADAVLPGWEISLVFVGPKKARALNEQLRAKDYTPNILSYEVGAKSGEIIICLAEAEKQAPLHEKSFREFVLYLFIHGLLHLKGLPHGATMERCEQKFVTRFYGTPHSRRH